MCRSVNSLKLNVPLTKYIYDLDFVGTWQSTSLKEDNYIDQFLLSETHLFNMDIKYVINSEKEF